MRNLLFILALGATVPALAQIPAPVTPAAPVTAPAGAIAPFKWTIRLVKGQKFRTTVDKTSNESEQEGALPGKAATAPIQTTTTEHLVFDQEVLSSDEKGARIELVYREYKRTSDEVLDGDGKPSPEAGDFKVGTHLRYMVSPQGKVSDVQGVDEFMKRIMAAYDQTQVEQAPDANMAQMMRTMRNGMEADFSHSAQEDMLGKSFGTLPTAPRALGQIWAYNSDLPEMMGLELKQTVTATFVGREGELVFVNESSVLSGKPDQTLDVGLPTEPGEAAPSLKVTISGNTQAQLKIDEKTGIVRFRRSTDQSQRIASIEVEGDKTEDVTDSVEESTVTTEILPPDTIVAAPVAAPAP